MIKELHLNNFKKHSHSSFYFTEGLNGIFGPNYTGKTTLLYAILFAMGGAAHVPGANLQKKGTATGMSVKMVFDINGQDYTVERKKSGAYLHLGDQLIASGTSNVTAKMEELIGMSIRRFKQLKYAEQKKAHALLTLGATELHNIIEELTGIDQINTVLEKVKEIVSTSSGALEALTFTEVDNLKDDRDDLRLILDSITEELAEVSATDDGLRTTYTLFNDKLSCLTEASKAWQKWRDMAASLLAEEKVLAHDIQQESAGIIGGDALADLEVSLRLKEKQMEEVTSKILDVKVNKNKLNDLLSQESKLTKEIQWAEKAIVASVKISDEIDENTDSFIALAEGDCEQWGDELSTAKAELNSLINLRDSSVCPTCERAYDEHDSFDPARIAAVESQVQSVSRQIESRNLDLLTFRRQAAIKAEAEQDAKVNAESLRKDFLSLASVREQLEPLREFEHVSLKTLTSEQSDLKSEVSRLSSNVQKITASEERLVSLRKRFSEVGNDITSMEREEPKFSQEELDQVSGAVTEYRKSLTEVSTQYQALLLKSSGLQHDLKSKEKEINTAELSNINYNRVKSRNGTAKQLQKYLRDNRDRYVGQVWDLFLGSASAFISGCTGGAVTEIQRTDSGQFQFVENGEVMGIKDASGAQEAIMGIAVQAALADSAQCPLDVLLVDEPTADMDAEHSLAVTGMLSSKGRQVIAISHREMDSSICDNIINMEEV